MHTTTAGNAGGDASGEIHRVVPFVANDLLTGQPATVELLAPDQGAVALDTMVEWPLPSNVLAGGEPSLYLAVLPLSTNGLDYWRLGTAAPPMLIVEQMP